MKKEKRKLTAAQFRAKTPTPKREKPDPEEFAPENLVATPWGKTKDSSRKTKVQLSKMYQDGQPLSDEETLRLFGKRKISQIPHCRPKNKSPKSSSTTVCQATSAQSTGCQLNEPTKPNCQICSQPLSVGEHQLDRRWHFECEKCQICEAHFPNPGRIRQCLDSHIPVSQ